MTDESQTAGIASGLRVVDLTGDIAGPMTTMLLADHGADVVRVERPEANRSHMTNGDVVWNRGKRRIRVDPDNPDDRRRLVELIDVADVVVESLPPGEAERFGIDPQTASARNPGLVYSSITPYGGTRQHSDRHGIEWLVTARTGMQWDQRGYFGTRMEHLMGTDPDFSSFEVPDGTEQTGCRDGPIFLAVPWASIGAALLASTSISAALFVRARTGRGQVVETSLLQAVLMENAMGWQRVSKMHPSYRLWYFDRRAPKGIFPTLDDRWLHQWAPFEHEFIRREADMGQIDGGMPLRTVSAQVEGYEQQVEREANEFTETARAVATRTVTDWVDRFAAAGLAAQPIRTPEEALFDAALEREGVIVELEDPEHGAIRQVGHIVGFDSVPNPPIRPRSSEITATDDIVDQWSASERIPGGDSALPDAPLTGIVVLDFGLAIAGPYGPQILADLGATVIKVTALAANLTDAIYVGSTQGKQALAVDLKHPRGREIADRLIQKADVVHHNMRSGVAERLGIGYADAARLNPAVVYCHTRGYERDGPRTHLPGNDQMGNALAGTEYEAGGVHHGTPPIWHTTAFGDTGTGVASAHAVVQALTHRERTGEGQFVHTSILNLCMLFNSYTFARVDGSTPDRQRIDAEQRGFSAVRRLYPTKTDWICIYVRDDRDWMALCSAVVAQNLADDPRFTTEELRRSHDMDLADVLANVFATETAATWIERLDRCGVPSEVASSTFARDAFDDPELRKRGWVIENHRADLGQVEQVGMPFTFSATSGQNLRGAPVTGEHTRPVLAMLGYDDDEIDDMVAAGIVRDGGERAASNSV